MRGRGLKQFFILLIFIYKLVAPHAGAWIETSKDNIAIITRVNLMRGVD